MTKLLDFVKKTSDHDYQAKVLDITAPALIRDRLLELGLAPGRTIQALRVLPFGGAIIVQAGNLFLALRQDEAEYIWVEKV